ncbi:DUF1329 domain-containing protein [Solimonas terrae]|nr:DUF1329 domain-containing protein [Solimonas terrae]
MTRKMMYTLAAIVLGTLAAQSAFAKVSAEQAAQLGGDKLTCMGAERAGNADGSIPAYSGKWLGAAWPGATQNGYNPGPYADEKPLFTIDSDNLAQYAERLTEGQKALLKRYPKAFTMPVYASHRDFRYPDWVCDAVRKNATSAELVHDGLGFTGTTGGIPFPFPSDGLEAQTNMQNPHRAWTEQGILDQFVVYPNGNRAPGRVVYKILSVWNDPKHRGSNQDEVNSYFYSETLLPERDKGAITLGWTPNDNSIDRQAWFYSPGTRRVRQAPEFGFDTPQGAGGFRTVDDDRLFNGSPERYDWQLLGKKEIYVPYDSFKQNDPAVRYDQLLPPSSVNPQYMRYELHRVWVLEATVKQGYRHIYAKRRFYVDEDSWHALWVDNYDARGQLWRASMVNYFYSPAIEGFQAGIAIYHDLTANAYYVDRLVNESKQWWQLNQGGLSADMFSPDAASRHGH